MKGKKASGRYHIGPNFQTSCVLFSCLSLSLGVASANIDRPLFELSDAFRGVVDPSMSKRGG